MKQLTGLGYQRSTGSVFVLAIVALVVMLLLAVTVLSMSQHLVRMSAIEARGRAALALAEAGVTYGIAEQGSHTALR